MLSGMQELIVEWSSIIYIKSKQYHSVSVTNKMILRKGNSHYMGRIYYTVLSKWRKAKGVGQSFQITPGREEH